MWIPIATIKIVIMQKNITAWTRMDIPLVHMLPNSITLVLDGNWNIIPGDNRMNKTTATITGPQSALIFSFAKEISSIACCHYTYNRILGVLELFFFLQYKVEKEEVCIILFCSGCGREWNLISLVLKDWGWCWTWWERSSFGLEGGKVYM